MSEPEWTPGPWRANKYGSVGAGETGALPIVAELQPFYGEDAKFGSHTANAHLIAAAPALYAQLEDAKITAGGGRKDTGLVPPIFREQPRQSMRDPLR